MSLLFFFTATATSEIYTLSLHDALPISCARRTRSWPQRAPGDARARGNHCSRSRRAAARRGAPPRSEEHTSELQSQFHLVCRLLLEKKKNKTTKKHRSTERYARHGRCVV